MLLAVAAATFVARVREARRAGGVRLLAAFRARASVWCAHRRGEAVLPPEASCWRPSPLSGISAASAARVREALHAGV